MIRQLRSVEYRIYSRKANQRPVSIGTREHFPHDKTQKLMNERFNISNISIKYEREGTPK